MEGPGARCGSNFIDLSKAEHTNIIHDLVGVISRQYQPVAPYRLGTIERHNALQRISLSIIKHIQIYGDERNEYPDAGCRMINEEQIITNQLLNFDLTFNSSSQNQLAMYRKSVDYGQHTAVQVVDFSTFKRKPDHPSDISLLNAVDAEMEIKKSGNGLVLALVITDLLIQARNKNRRPNRKVFTDFIIDNVPKLQHNFQHQNTLEQLLTCISSRAKDLTSIHDLLINNTVTEFVLHCYARKTIKNYIMGNFSHLNLHGNQEDILIDYNAEIRGQLLHILALSFQINVSILYKYPSGQLDDTFKEVFGDSNSPNRLQICDLGCSYRVSISLEEEENKLSSISSSQNILNIQNKGKKEPESLNTTIEAQTHRLDSRSANKDLRCVKCSAKGVCQCDRSTRKAVVTRQLTSNLPSRSIFDGLGLGGPKRQTSTQEISASKR